MTKQGTHKPYQRDHIISQVSKFKYHESIIQDNRESDSDINGKIQVRFNEMTKCFTCHIRCKGTPKA
ncbi:hypothetical protein Lal_00033958 [Lupinus albus]|nr:hypothetical protein Lal_00033958 [Lupinus albus]